MKLFLIFPLIASLTISAAYAQRGGRGIGAAAGTNIATPVAGTNARVDTSAHTSASASSNRPVVSDQITSNSQLSARLSPLLPAGTSVTQASTGFKNLGSFVAAVHVSHNLGIPFDQLKAKVVAGESLGAAVHDLNANANAKAEIKKARKQSHDDMSS